MNNWFGPRDKLQMHEGHFILWGCKTITYYTFESTSSTTYLMYNFFKYVQTLCVHWHNRGASSQISQHIITHNTFKQIPFFQNSQHQHRYKSLADFLFEISKPVLKSMMHWHNWPPINVQKTTTTTTKASRTYAADYMDAAIHLISICSADLTDKHTHYTHSVALSAFSM